MRLWSIRFMWFEGEILLVQFSVPVILILKLDFESLWGQIHFTCHHFCAVFRKDSRVPSWNILDQNVTRNLTQNFWIKILEIVNDRRQRWQKAFKTQFCLFKLSKVEISKQCNVGLLNIMDFLEDRDIDQLLYQFNSGVVDTFDVMQLASLTFTHSALF